MDAGKMPEGHWRAVGLHRAGCPTAKQICGLAPQLRSPYPTEFGQKLHLSVVDGYTYLEQTSWNNFNEGCDLEAAVEDYARKFGCCPSAVLADRIYQTRANKLYCKELGIRLSGPPLGRRKANQTDAKIKRQMYCDSCERSAVEGRNGNAKRRFGLDRLFSKLDETAKTEAALILLAMNACHRLARWLVLFFLKLFSFFASPVFYADSIVVISYVVIPLTQP